MLNNWDKSLQLLLKHEGGFVNHPKDPGGMTNLGVTKKTWEGYVGHVVSEAEMRALTPAKVEPLYKARYWNMVRCDELPAGVDYCVFDTCVNSGPHKAILFLQDALGAKMDGQLSFLKTLSTWDTFGRGWGRRVEEVERDAKNMVG